MQITDPIDPVYSFYIPLAVILITLLIGIPTAYFWRRRRHKLEVERVKMQLATEVARVEPSDPGDPLQAIKPIREEFERNIAHLKGGAEVVALRASFLTNISAYTRVSTIVLGAVIATSGTATQIFGEDNSAVLLIYTGLGVLIAALGGIEAAFKLQSNANARRQLSSEIEGKSAAFRTKWAQYEGKTRLQVQNVSEGEMDQLLSVMFGDASKILNELVEYYASIQQRSAELGVNLARERLREQELEQEVILQDEIERSWRLRQAAGQAWPEDHS